MLAKLRARLDRLATGGLILLACALCASVYFALTPATGKTSTEPPALAPKQTFDTDASPLTEERLSAVWKHRDPVEGAPPSRVVSVTAKPALFTVRGIIYSSTGESVAFIEDKGNLVLCAVGHQLDGWEISAIEATAVTVIKDGEEHRLFYSPASYANRPLKAMIPFGKSETQAVASRAVGARHRQVSDRTRQNRDEGTRRVASVAAAPLRRAPRDHNADATQALPRSIAEKARRDPEALADGVKMSPALASDGKKMIGVSIDHVANGSIAARYGLATGDRVVAVNGQTIDSPTRAYQLYQRYRNSDEVSVTIERGGKRKTVLYYVQ